MPLPEQPHIRILLRRRVAQPLTRRLPLLIAFLLCLVAGGISWAAYIQVRRAVLETTDAHLHSASGEIADALQASLRRLPHDLEPLARDPAVAAVMRGLPGTDTGAAARAMAAFRARSPQYAAVSVWSRTGDLRLVSGSRLFAEAMRSSLDRAAGTSFQTVGPFVVVHDSVAFGIVFPSVALSGDTVGFVVGSRRFDDSGGAALMGKLLGENARLVLGNVGGDVWTNLLAPVPAPPAVAREHPGAAYTGADGQPHIGAVTPLGGTSWIVWVDAPLEASMVTARRFLLDIVAIGLVFVLIGGIAAWIIVRRVLRPLQDVERAAEELALGELTRPVAIRTNDEIGSLASSFNTMAERVRSAGEELLRRAHTLEQRNQELRESELRYRQLVDQSPDAIVVHRGGRIVFANAVTASLLGAANSADLVGRSLLDLVHSADREEVKRRIATILKSRKRSPLTEIRLLTLDRREVIVEVSGTAVVFDGEPAVQTFARDVTQRKLLEDQFRQSQKMEAVGRLAGGIAHDFNNLLTVITMYTEVTLAGMGQHDPKRADMEGIRHAATSAGHLTRQMLAFSRKQVLAPRKLDVNEAIVGVTRMLDRVLGEDVEIVTQLRPEIGPIWADGGQLEQVLVNLAVNARDAMPDGGTVRIETSEVTLARGSASPRAVVPAGSYVLLVVADTGAGMTDETKASIFEPFFTTKQPGHGTGLGLSTVYGIVKQSGGYIWVSSELGRGTRFELYFPRYGGSEAAVGEPASESALASVCDASILLVEDDAMVRLALQRILQSVGYSVMEAASAPEAIALFAANDGKFDLVITDMMMPVMTGAELVRDLRTRHPALRTIIMSGYSEEVTSREWRLPPNSVFLEKPIASGNLLRCVGDVLGD
ncbi:MAG: sensor protein [Gemmatimonadetes bacterium]|nr:sensor protein [Gemmatimonadota bacterium]